MQEHLPLKNVAQIKDLVSQPGRVTELIRALLPIFGISLNMSTRLKTTLPRRAINGKRGVVAAMQGDGCTRIGRE